MLLVYSTKIQFFFCSIAENFDAFVQFWHELEKSLRDLHQTLRFSSMYTSSLLWNQRPLPRVAGRAKQKGLVPQRDSATPQRVAPVVSTDATGQPTALWADEATFGERPVPQQ